MVLVGCDAFGIGVAESAGLDEPIAAGLAHDGPALVEVNADPDLP